MITLRSLVLVGALCATATAQPAPSPTPPDAADAALAEGRRLYDLREFAAAIEKFKEAYRLRNDAASLFNIAQSYRLMGDCPNAYDFYKTFQRNFPSERPEVVAKFIEELEPCKEPKRTLPTETMTNEPTPAEPQRVAPGVETPMRDEPAAPGRTLRIAGIAVGGAGVAALGTGVFFGLRARSQSKDLNASDEWNPSLDASAQRADRNAKILLAAGGAAVIGGAVLFYLGVRAGAESSQVALIPSDEGATLAWSFRFQ